jgi:hypothetical protein
VPPTLSSDEQRTLERLTRAILKNYRFKGPPVPIETIMSSPPEGLLEAVDISDLSIVFGVGEHRYEYRMAMARLLYREICRRERDHGMELPHGAGASRYFASALLIPKKWVLRATRWPFTTLKDLAEKFEVPEYVMAPRLMQLGKQVRGME